MANTVTNVQLVAAGANLTGDATNPYSVNTIWSARVLADGSMVTVAVQTPVPTTDPLDQAAWDLVYADALSGFATVTGGGTAGSNPVAV